MPRAALCWLVAALHCGCKAVLSRIEPHSGMRCATRELATHRTARGPGGWALASFRMRRAGGRVHGTTGRSCVAPHAISGALSCGCAAAVFHDSRPSGGGLLKERVWPASLPATRRPLRMAFIRVLYSRPVGPPEPASVVVGVHWCACACAFARLCAGPHNFKHSGYRKCNMACGREQQRMWGSMWMEVHGVGTWDQAPACCGAHRFGRRQGIRLVCSLRVNFKVPCVNLCIPFGICA